MVARLTPLIAMYGHIPVTAGESTPNVAGKWEGTWSHQRFGSGEVTFQTVSGDTMTGTACGYTCATLKLKKSPV